MYQHYLGVDLHRRRSYVVLMDNQGNLIDHAAAPIWSPDGNLLVYTQLSTNSVMVMETGQWQPQRTGLPSQIGIVKWISE